MQYLNMRKTENLVIFDNLLTISIFFLNDVILLKKVYYVLQRKN